MGRPPCCDKVGIKKGPWTPEEDIILVSYIQEHGPGNWRAVPTNTGLLRCSKSCRLRWTNYLRPGIKRGNFTPHEEGMIIHLQALLGNKWAAIATYLPQRTDNDIKNYWNTHLKKKLKKFQSGLEPQMATDSTSYHQFMSKNYGERVMESEKHQSSGIKMSENSSVYASSAENISRLLEGWMRSSPPQANNTNNGNNRDKFYCDFGKMIMPNEYNDASASIQCYRPHQIHDDQHQGTNNGNDNIATADDHHELECILSFDQNLSIMANNNNCDKSSCDSSLKGSDESSTGFVQHAHQKAKMDNNNPPLSFLEKWLLDESAGQVEGVMELPPIF